MQSDDRVAGALAALRAPIDQYRFAVSAALDRARAVVAAESENRSQLSPLGDFASGLISIERFAQVAGGAVPISATAHAVIARCIEALEQILDSRDNAFVVNAGNDVARAVNTAFARLGSAFQCARIVELIRRGEYDLSLHGLPGEKQFSEWGPAERRIAPPLVVVANGELVDPMSIAPFIDGSVKIVLILKGETSPALLARLISPQVFVAQSSDATVLAALKDFDGPAVIALIAAKEAQFTHDPRGGWAAWQRLRITHMPDAAVRRGLGKRSAWQMREDLAHLKSLADLPSVTSDRTSRPPAPAIADPAERIAAWLLEQSA